jgi:hypothetical protein
MAQATSLGGAIRSDLDMRRDTPERIEYAMERADVGIARVEGAPNENQVAIMALADHLDPAASPTPKVPRGTYSAQVVRTTPEELRRKALRFMNSD